MKLNNEQDAQTNFRTWKYGLTVLAYWSVVPYSDAYYLISYHIFPQVIQTNHLTLITLKSRFVTDHKISHNRVHSITDGHT